MPTIEDYDDSWQYIEDIADEAGEELSLPFPIPFTSTTGNILAVTFFKYKMDPTMGVLFVMFKNGPYRYFDVPVMTALGFSYASSATQYLNDQIKGVYDYEGG